MMIVLGMWRRTRSGCTGDFRTPFAGLVAVLGMLVLPADGLAVEVPVEDTPRPWYSETVETGTELLVAERVPLPRLLQEALRLRRIALADGLRGQGSVGLAGTGAT